MIFFNVYRLLRTYFHGVTPTITSCFVLNWNTLVAASLGTQRSAEFPFRAKAHAFVTHVNSLLV
jgi:hypothetical protein